MKGSYILVIELKNSQKIKIGKLGHLFFKEGFYIYVGSAMNNLEKRITRHLSTNKKLHWYIDYFSKKASIIEAYVKENTIKEECKIAHRVFENLETISGFGCTDCTCESHLFYGSLDKIYSIIRRLDMKKYLF